MQITINQTEIETAIRNHILSQITVNNNMVIDIDLKATRGPEGYSAVINIRPDGEPTGGKPVEAPADQVADAKDAGDSTPVAETPKAEAPKAEAEKAEAPKEAANDTAAAEDTTGTKPSIKFGRKQDEAPAPAADAVPTRSIFAGMTKPNNAATA